MAIKALNNYKCRNRHSGVAEVLPITRGAADASRFKKGDPLALSSGKATAVTVASGLVTNSAILGFSDHTDYSRLNYPSHIAGTPVVPEPESGLDEILYYSGTNGNIHTFPLKSNQAPAVAMIGQSYDLGYDSTNEVFYIDTSSTAHPLAKVVGIEPGSLGVNGGSVDFIVAAWAGA